MEDQLITSPAADESELNPELVIEEDDSLVAIPITTATRRFDSFAEADLEPALTAAIAKLGWTNPTPVQSLCLPHTLEGRHVAGFAQTGTGKTGVFLITAANNMLKNPAPVSDQVTAYPRAIVLCPTRELAMQIQNDAQPMFDDLGIRSLAVFGGIDYEKQARTLKDGTDVIFATPGRLKDYFQKKIISLERCGIFVCDEADRMFDMGFIDDVEFFLNQLPETTQRLLFSATTNEQVKELAFEYLDKPEYISVNPEVITPELIEQHAIICEAKNKLKVMLGMLADHKPECCIVFTNTKLTAEWLHFKLVNNGIDADLITGDLPQNKRINLIQRIKQGKIKALIATDVASRGLHISRVTHVYNFDLPDEASNYVHRIGRTARAGAKGSSYALVCEDYGGNLLEINQLLGEALALKAEWFDPKYLEIVDKAGNPFADRMQPRASEPRYSGGRGEPRRDGAPSRGGGRGPQRDRPRHERGPRQGEPPQRDQHRGERQGRPHQDRRPQRGNRPQPSGSQHQFGAHAAPTMQVVKPQATVGIGAVLKRMVSTIFGRKKT